MPMTALARLTACHSDVDIFKILSSELAYAIQALIWWYWCWLWVSSSRFSISSMVFIVLSQASCPSTNLFGRFFGQKAISIDLRMQKTLSESIT